MGYQALLFCPDEKTARSVTQVLSELDFTVIPCTEPFGAVKKLMAEHFDAVVVDCDNEQNATLLFKSARNTPNNQSALAVAVVEGQAGVAKAFRIGANLVLTKPINVEQAKGTLRVARGLLRKNEAVKSAAPGATASVNPAKPAAAPAKPAASSSSAPGSAASAPNSRVVAPRPVQPVKPLVKTATASVPTQKPQLPRAAASVPAKVSDSQAHALDAGDDIATPAATPSVVISSTSAPSVAASVAAPATKKPVSPPAIPAVMSSGAASAPAPAREPKPSVAAEHASSTIDPIVIPEAGTVTGKVADLNVDLGSETSSGETKAPASAFTFGGNVSDGEKAAGGGRKKTVLWVALVVLLAAGSYAVWMQWVGSSGAATPFTHAPQVAIPAVAPQAPHKAVVPSTPPPATSPATTPPQPAAPDAATVPSAGSAKISSDSNAPDAGSGADTTVHPGKGNSSKSAPAPAAKAPAAKAAAQPIMIKNNHSPSAANAAPSGDETAPSVSEIAPADNGGALSNLVGGAGAAPAPVLQTPTISQGVSQGLLVKKISPVYPASSLQMHVEGEVKLLATVSKAGNISAVKILNGDPGLARAGVDAVKQWKYKPYLLNGEPVEIQTEITLNFKLPR